jgi:predicted amidohydrolase YtcJ
MPGAPHDLADVVFRVGRAYGMTADRGIYQAVAVKDGRISAVGRSRDELDSFVGPGTAVIDDPELVLYPAFNDTHNHQLLAARDLDYVSLEQARSIGELVASLRGAADRTPSGEWVISSRCWHETHLREGRLPTALELDAASARHPVFVQRGGHVGVANSAALRMAGITATSADPASGTVVRLPTGPRSACSSRVARSTRSGGCFRRCRRLSRLTCSRGSASSTTAVASASSATPGSCRARWRCTRQWRTAAS